MNNNNTNDYYSLSRPEVQELVSAKSKTILDVGCAEGQMASELKKRNKSEVWGIEIVPNVAQKAKEKLDKVLIGSVEEQILKLPDNYFDPIVFADVLEHLVQPEKVLQEIKSKLKDEGEIIVSLPNIRNWEIIIALLDGSFDYSDYGILDRTHLRFFTLGTAKKMIENAGYFIKEMQPVQYGYIEIPKSLLDEFRKMDLNVDDLQEKSMHFQYLFKAKKSNAKILFNSAMAMLNNGNYELVYKYIGESICKIKEEENSKLNIEKLKRLQLKIKQLAKIDKN